MTKLKMFVFLYSALGFIWSAFFFLTRGLSAGDGLAGVAAVFFLCALSGATLILSMRAFEEIMRMLDEGDNDA